MPFVCTFVFRQKLRESDVLRIKEEVPDVFVRLAQSKGQRFDPQRVGLSILDAVSRNIFSPESHAKGFQGLDILLLVFGTIPDVRERDTLREELESCFRDRWVVRARVFDVPIEHWKVPVWDASYVPMWNFFSEGE